MRVLTISSDYRLQVKYHYAVPNGDCKSFTPLGDNDFLLAWSELDPDGTYYEHGTVKLFAVKLRMEENLVVF